MEFNTTEFFLNIKDLPPVGTPEFQQLVDWETEKCMGGIKINGVLITGWLYFHLNHWHLRADAKDRWKNVIRVAKRPDLRDNEWIRAEALETCKLQSKGYMEVGLRQGGKSEFEASVTGYNALLFKHTQNVIVGGNGPDLNLLTDKLDFGLVNMWEGLFIPRIDKDWKKPMVKLGYKNKKNEDDVWSYIIIRNADGGDNTEAPAGTTSKSFVMDEVGKYSFGQVFSAAREAFISEYGWRTIPVLVGTGGSFENGADAQRYFENPDSNNFLAFTEESTGKRTCLFMSGLYRQDCKIEMGLGTFLKRESKIEQDAPIDVLDQVIIKVSDKELALKKITEERAEKAKDPDKVEYLKTIMYKPLTAEECFMNNSVNIFNVEDAKRQQRVLHSQGRTGTPVILVWKDDKIGHEFTDKLPISAYPLRNNESKDAPVVIYEHPPENPPFGLYVAGVDPYRQGQSAYSSSLGAVYVYKRMHDINSEKYQDMIVASYVARPDKKDTWEEQARLLIRYYNARALCENDDISFIEYMKSKGDGHYLERQPAWLMEVVPNSMVKREYGIHRSSDKIRDYLHNCLKKYLETVLDVVRGEDGSLKGEIRGVTRILDPVLLDEIIKYNEDDNFDRIVAVELAIAMAYSLDPMIGRIGGEDDSRFKAYFGKFKKNAQALFTDGPETRVFSQRTRNKSKLFL